MLMGKSKGLKCESESCNCGVGRSLDGVFDEAASVKKPPGNLLSKGSKNGSFLNWGGSRRQSLLILQVAKKPPWKRFSNDKLIQGLCGKDLPESGVQDSLLMSGSGEEPIAWVVHRRVSQPNQFRN